MGMMMKSGMKEIDDLKAQIANGCVKLAQPDPVEQVRESP